MGLVTDQGDGRVESVLLERGHQHVDVVLPERGLDLRGHPLEGGRGDVSSCAGTGERARQQDVRSPRDPGQPSGRLPEAGPAFSRERTVVITGAAVSVGNGRGVANQQEVHEALWHGSSAPCLPATALEPRPLLEKRGARLLSTLALPFEKLLLERMLGLSAADDFV